MAILEFSTSKFNSLLSGSVLVARTKSGRLPGWRSRGRLKIQPRNGLASNLLKNRLNAVAYANWIEQTSQIRRDGSTVLVWLPDQTTRYWIEQEYTTLITEALHSIGPFTVTYTADGG